MLFDLLLGYIQPKLFLIYNFFLKLVNVTRISVAEIRQKELNLEREMFKRHDEFEIKDVKVGLNFYYKNYISACNLFCFVVFVNNSRSPE